MPTSPKPKLMRFQNPTGTQFYKFDFQKKRVHFRCPLCRVEGLQDDHPTKPWTISLDRNRVLSRSLGWELRAQDITIDGYCAACGQEFTDCFEDKPIERTWKPSFIEEAEYRADMARFATCDGPPCEHYPEESADA